MECKPPSSVFGVDDLFPSFGLAVVVPCNGGGPAGESVSEEDPFECAGAATPPRPPPPPPSPRVLTSITERNDA